MAMERRLPTLESTPTGIHYSDDARRAVKNWVSHVIDLFHEWVPQDADPFCELVLDALKKRLNDCGGPGAILSPKERRAWETVVLSMNSSQNLAEKSGELG